MNKVLKGIGQFSEFAFCTLIIGSGVVIGYEMITYGLNTLKDI